MGKKKVYSKGFGDDRVFIIVTYSRSTLRERPRKGAITTWSTTRISDCTTSSETLFNTYTIRGGFHQRPMMDYGYSIL